jgi:FkbM family methyltransferase
MLIFKRITRKIVRDVRKHIRLRWARKVGLAYVEPNFVYWPRIKSGDTVVDAGCSYEADFSLLMINQYGAKSFAVDPTRKHRPSLAALEARFCNMFFHLPIAIGPSNGELIFHESENHESGSLMDNHTNVKSDKIVSYNVRSVTLTKLIEELETDKIAILKLDIEGAEYPLLLDVKASDLASFDQIFIEFHHHAVSNYGIQDTKLIVDRIMEIGFRSFSLDEHNYLFWRE